MARVTALVDAGAAGSIALDVDAARAFDVLTSRQRIQPPPCGWRALFVAGHGDCASGRKCKCKRPGSKPYDPSAEGPLVAQLKPMLSPALQALVQG